MQDKVRLIDANAMRDDWLENGENEYIYDTNAVLESIDNQPTIDAVPVVRCKECANSYVPHNGFARRCRKFNRLVGEMEFCSCGLTEEEYNEMERELVEMDICSDGERCE